MRIDLALRYLCIARSRSSVKTLCDDDAILVNDQPVRASTTLRENDRVTIRRKRGTSTWTILRVPEKQLSKVAAREYYRVDHESDEDDTTDWHHVG